MFFRLPRGRKVPRYDFKDQAPIRLDEARLAAWALALGDLRPSADPPRCRLHRGMLPDIDVSGAVPLPQGPSLLRRIVVMLLRRLARRTPAVVWSRDAAGEDKAVVASHIDTAADNLAGRATSFYNGACRAA